MGAKRGEGADTAANRGKLRGIVANGVFFNKTRNFTNTIRPPFRHPPPVCFLYLEAAD